MIDHDDEIDDAITPAVEPAKPAGERKAVEFWAAAKGMLPEFFDAPAVSLSAAFRAPGGVAVLTAQEISKAKPPRHNPEFWKFTAARAMHGWVIGAELTEQEFDDAITAATTATGG